ncbi:hypothetical protein GCM10007147_31770 [Nocardiopsis kunsanensis]|uniref:DUF1707 domain-containing protein n=1 Tax=Nocardiopsis kunsanensis TaxID=141693 RepID=A0A918XFW7_9ACTN|nr:DUF1707 domain-containing protein [Nocardiopsis kunsanensis]GHD30210.1 hypothetical protein GCM10007147_31770 [Nocardiopsis kunsanensis]
MSDPRYLISDAERDEALRHLRTALEEGRLSVHEHGQRTQETLQARTNEDLRPLFGDLPPQLWPDTVGQSPAPAVTTSSTPTTEGTPHPRRRDDDEDEDEDSMSFGSAAAVSGFLFFVWGLPAMVSGSTASFLVFLGVLLVFVLGPAATRIARSFRARHRGVEGP